MNRDYAPESDWSAPGRGAGRARPTIWSDHGAFDPTAIPARPWVIPGLLLRGTVTLLTGAGASGKSSVTTSLAVAGAAGAPIGRFRPAAPFRTLIFNAEEDRDEQRRRIAAAATALGVAIDRAAEAITRAGPAETALLFEVLTDRGTVQATRAFAALCDLVAEVKPDVIALDPLVELHSADENANVALRAVVARLRTVAQVANAAVFVIHHARKGGQAGDQDSARGASAIASAARLHVTATRMTRDEAVTFWLPESHARHFLRLDVGKSNYAAAWEADWFELRPIEIGNGDAVVAVVPWIPPAPTTDVVSQAKAEAALRGGWNGEPCSRSPNSSAFYGHALDAVGLPRAAHGALLNALIAAGTARERAWRDPGVRKVFKRLWVAGSAFDGWIDADS